MSQILNAVSWIVDLDGRHDHAPTSPSTYGKHKTSTSASRGTPWCSNAEFGLQGQDEKERRSWVEGALTCSSVERARARAPSLVEVEKDRRRHPAVIIGRGRRGS